MKLWGSTIVNEKNYVSVVIPTMNRPDTLQETLNSYINGDVLPDQIVIIDQTPNYYIRQQVENVLNQYETQVRIEYVYQEVPSLTKARNIGISMCKHDIIVFSDDDITVQKDTIKNVIEIMKNKEISMIAGINSRDRYSTSKIGYFFGKKSYRKRNIGHVAKSMNGRFPEKKVQGTVDTEWAMGFFFVIRKSLIDKWENYWDENLTSYAYAEDLDFSYSYFKHSVAEGLRCILDERIMVEHRVSNEWRVPSRKSTMMYVINREYLSYKHKMGWTSRILTRWCNFGEFLMRAFHKMNPSTVLKAQLVCDKYRGDIKKGIIRPEWYE